MSEIVARKRCNKCGEWKDRSEFYKHKRHSDGLASDCKVCQRKTKKQDPVKARARVNKWRVKNADKKKEYNQKWFAENREKSRSSHLKRAYGLSVSEYEEMLRKQNGVCAICGGSNGEKPLHVDHDHKTGKVRKLLCGACNKALGMVRDNESILLKMVKYLLGFRN
jgi:hypothetical protein